ncbi:MAG: diguanylate cyclase, partial [Lachnospiraceae bacterium]|nr:diguanylate cyclase [Lachnospiraceae bacterium]
RGRKNRDEVVAEAQRILDHLAAVKVGELDGIHSSVGITELSVANHDIDTAYTKADEALYRSKETGKHRITFSEEN